MTNDDPVRALTDEAHLLVQKINELNRDAGRQLVALGRRAKSNRRLIWIIFVGFALDIVLTVAMAVVGSSVVALTHRLDYAQTTNRKLVLCPLYTLFLQSRSPRGRAASPDPKAYDHAFLVIEDGYRTLKCDPPLPPKK